MTAPDPTPPVEAAPVPTAPVFILVRPQLGENIGASARAMLNFGLEAMRIVAPRDGWPNPKAAAMASGAGRVLDHAGVFVDLPGALGDCTRVYATTARARDLTRPVLTPEAAMREARDLIDAGGRVAVLFGPERAGLENDDVALASAVVSVPVNAEFPSLNLAQCVLLTAYEWARASAADVPAPVAAMAAADRATGLETARLWDHFDERLSAAGYFFPESKAVSMRRNLRAMLTRLDLTRADAQMLHGILRQLTRQRPG